MAGKPGLLLRVVLVVAAVVFVAAAQQDDPAPGPSDTPQPSDGGTLVPSPGPSTNIPGGTLIACRGEVVATETAEAGERGGLTLQVYYSAEHSGRSCATVTKTGTAWHRDGQLTVVLQRHNYDGRRWPRYAIQVPAPDAARSGAVYLDDTAGRCVRAEARFDPDRGRTVTVTSGKVGCG